MKHLENNLLTWFKNVKVRLIACDLDIDFLKVKGKPAFSEYLDTIISMVTSQKLHYLQDYKEIMAL